MSDTGKLFYAEDAAIPYPSLASLKEAHAQILKRYRKGESEEILSEIEAFIRQGRATGALLDIDDDRWTCQSLLDYWVTALYSANRNAPDSTLAEFDPSLAPDLEEAGSPYMGLDAFQEIDKEKFFGRQRLIDEMLGQLANRRLLVAIGPSGSGKSSLVLAGLLPALKAGSLPGSKNWHYFPRMVPGSNPLKNLALAILPDDQISFEQIQRHIEGFKDSPDHLLNVVNNMVGVPAVMIIDQFEEVFTLCTDDDLLRAFVDNLMSFAQSPDRRHTVILTIRADFEPHVMRLSALQLYFEQAQVRVTPLSAAELRLAIEEPAARIGLKFDQGIVEELVKDILGEPAGLPLLQFTLLRLWKSREGNRVTWRAYKALGGARHALACTADEFFKSLLYEEQITTRRILLRLARPGEGLEITSNRVRRKTLHKSKEDNNRIDNVLQKLVNTGLVRLTQGATRDDDQVEIAHEALVRNWPTLVAWLEDERAFLRKRLRLASAAEQWLAHDRDAGGLLGGSLLDEALRYQDLNDLETEFVQASQTAIKEAEREKEAARQRELDLEKAQTLAEEQKQRAEQEAAVAGKFRLLASMLTVVILMTIGATAFAMIERSQAKKHERNALAARTEALDERNRADDRAKEAEIAKKQAEDAKEEALVALITAKEERLRADKERQRAEDESNRADDRAREAEIAKRQAEDAKEDALIALNIADKERQRAEDESKRADDRAKEAEIAKKQAEDAKEDALIALNTAKEERLRADKERRRAEEEAKKLEEANKILLAVRAVDELKRRADNYYRSGELQEALNTYENVQSLHSLDKNNIGVAEVLSIKSKVYEELKNTAEAEKAFKAALELYKGELKTQEEKAGPEDQSLVPILSNFGNFYRGRKEYAEAEALYIRALKIQENNLRTNDTEGQQEFNRLIDELVTLYNRDKRYPEVENLHTQALETAKRVIGPDSLYVSDLSNKLANFYRTQGRYVEAEPLYKRSIEIRMKAGSDSNRVHDIYQSLVRLYIDQGRYADTDIYYKKMLEGRMIDPEDYNISNELGKYYQDKGKYAAAEPFYKEALAVVERVFGSTANNSYVIRSLNNLAALYRDQSRYAEAEVLYKRVLDGIKDKETPSPDLVASLNNLAGLYRDQSKYAPAIVLYEKAIGLSEQLKDSSPVSLATSLNDLATLYYDQGALTEAERLYKQAIAVAEKVKSGEPLILSFSTNGLARVYSKQDKYNEAEIYFDRALAIREKALGPNHPRVAETLEYFAELLRKTNRKDEASKIEARAKAIRERQAQDTQPR